MRSLPIFFTCLCVLGSSAIGAGNLGKPKRNAPTNAAPSYTYEGALRVTNYLATKRVLRKVVERERPKDAAEANAWTQALLALVSLERLMGDEKTAREQFARCDSLCAELVTAEEWRSIREWGCDRETAAATVCKAAKKIHLKNGINQ